MIYYCITCCKRYKKKPLECTTCKRYQSTPSTPVISMPEILLSDHLDKENFMSCASMAKNHVEKRTISFNNILLKLCKKRARFYSHIAKRFDE